MTRDLHRAGAGFKNFQWDVKSRGSSLKSTKTTPKTGKLTG